MIYLQSFRMPTRNDEENYFANPSNFKAKRTCYTTKYPFDLFRYRELPEFYFNDIKLAGIQYFTKNNNIIHWK